MMLNAFFQLSALNYSLLATTSLPQYPDITPQPELPHDSGKREPPSDYENAESLKSALAILGSLGFSPEEEARCSFLNVEYNIPETEYLRSPKKITSDIADVFWSKKLEMCEPCECNARLQRLLFERMVWLDSRSDQNSLNYIDILLKEAYLEVYTPKPFSQVLPITRKLQLEAAAVNLLEMRMPLLEILYGKIFNPDLNGLVTLIDFLSSDIASLYLSACTLVPEEKILVDMLRSLRAITHHVIELTKGE
ncbi:hypothetical protein JCM33374_g3601 [Metschnikowia sp. JCM 33374]|nr:hypothetical protein JCM33374_g3601 [Metschnikowia sp. JCM 33374]